MSDGTIRKSRWQNVFLAGWLVSALFLAMHSSASAVSPTLRVDSAGTDCSNTASSVDLDLVLPIQAGGESFKTGYWVYQTSGSDHTGKDSCALDFFDVLGKRMVAVEDGTVEVAKWQNRSNKAAGYGYYVLVRHDKAGANYYTLYAHLQDPETSGFPQECKVAPGLAVSRGDCIGISGSTGTSPIDHLHFSMWTGTGPFADDVTPIAPETMRGIKLYGTLGPHAPLVSMATAERVTWIMPSLSLTVNETQSRTFVFANTSRITWDRSNAFELVKISGDAPGAPGSIPLSEPVAPGQDIGITIPITGTSPGIFESEWQLHHNDVPFGPTIPLRYTVSVDAEAVADLPSQLWELVKAMVWEYFENLLLEYLNNLLEEFLKGLFQICGLAPVGFTGIMLGMAILGKERRRFSEGAPGGSSGRTAWTAILRQSIGIVVTVFVFTVLFKIGRELIWWNSVIKSAGLVILGFAFLLLIWSVIQMVRLMRNLGIRRLLLGMLIVLSSIVFLHGQRYRADEPILIRYAASVGDLSWLATDKLIDLAKGSSEFWKELATLTGIELSSATDEPEPVVTASPAENSTRLPDGEPSLTSDPSSAGTSTACILVWEDHPEDDLGGKNRSMVWNEIVSMQVQDSGMTASQFNSLVVEQNPQLIADGYEFRNGKQYKLPRCQ